MGDNVNLASRTEGITKQYHVQIVISEATYRRVSSQFVCRELDKIRVKGKNLPVNIYELMDVVAENPSTKSCWSNSTGPWRLTGRKIGVRPPHCLPTSC